MTKREAFNGKPYAGNPHIRFDEGEVASTTTPRRGSLLYKKLFMMIDAMVVICATIPAMAGTALNVTLNNGSISVGIPAGAADAESKLYLVWDTEDHGDELSAWPAENRIVYNGALSASAATYVFATDSLPSDYRARAIVAKAVNVIDGYIYCGANQCVNTGILATDVYSLAIKYAIPATEGSEAWVLIGAARDNGTIARYSTNLYLRWTGQDQGFVFGNDLYSSSAVHEIAVGGGEVKLDNTVTKSGIPTGAMGTTAKTVLMSAGWNNNTIERYMKARWYYARLNDADGNALIDLVPALTNGSVAVFYDKVSHKYFGNAGSSTAALTYSGDAVETNFTLASSAIMSSVTAATWTGGGETALLSDAGNWTPGLPGAFSNPVRINAPNSKPAIVPAGATAYGKFFVGDGSEGTLEQTQGAVTASAINGVIIGSGSGSIGRYTMTGGTLTTKYAGTGDDALYVGTGSGSTGYFDVGGNAYVSPRKLNIGTSDNSKGYLTVSDNGTVNVRGDINVGTYQNGCYGEVTQSGGIVTTTNAWMKIAYAGTGKYTLSGGKIIVKGQLYAGYGTGSHGVLKQSGGEIAVTEDLIVGGYSTSAKGRGEVVMEDGSVNVGRYCMIGLYGTGSFTQSGGKISCNNWTAIGRYSGGVGYCTVTGGNFTVKDTKGLNIGEDGTGTLTVGGTGVVTAGTAASGYGIKLGANSGSSGTLKLRESGKIVTKCIKKGAGAATLAEFDGGTIQATVADANILEGLGNVVLKSGGVTIDTQGKNLVIKDCTFNVEPGGKITVKGSGTVTFTNCTVNYKGSLAGAVVFAEVSEGDDCTFGSNTFTGKNAQKMRTSENGKMIKIVPPGLIISFH